MSDELNDMGSAERACRLAELAQAIDDARRAAWQLCVGEWHSSEAKQLCAELDVARAEVESLRRGGWGRREVDLPPLWLQSLIRREPAPDLLD